MLTLPTASWQRCPTGDHYSMEPQGRAKCRVPCPPPHQNMEEWVSEMTLPTLPLHASPEPPPGMFFACDILRLLASEEGASWRLRPPPKSLSPGCGAVRTC